jgi:ATP-dependent Clp protease protease subunit
MTSEEKDNEPKVAEEVVEEVAEEVAEEETGDLLSALMGPKEPRVIGLFGDIDEEKSSIACASLISFYKMSESEPIELFISTNGGSADDMFAIVDTIKHLDSKGCEVHLAGIGKVMSAGVLILASGTKGKRRVGSNTRLMLHSVQGGTQGPYYNMKEDMANMKKSQEHYAKVLCQETKMTMQEVKKILNRKKDTYFTAHQAIEMGIADEIL